MRAPSEKAPSGRRLGHRIQRGELGPLQESRLGGKLTRLKSSKLEGRTWLRAIMQGEWHLGRPLSRLPKPQGSKEGRPKC
ncbi:unnamed protein product [Ilex paraguariensis]|uniref:Uncharacterized protein n=1 Tax=Ilex paraguariensis TaxID=185542 RepID=A0ABC8U4A6_9AQUA